MKYDLNGKTVNIPDAEITNLATKLELTKEEAIELWLDDNGYTDNEEQEELENKAKKERIDAGAGTKKRERAKETKPRVVKVSDEKTALFESILANLDRCEGVERENISVLTKNKLIEVKIGTHTFKINISENRKPKTA